jgi:transcriptional regulator with XRE-family HTH domain
MAKMLSDRDIDSMHPSTIAKIELGERPARIDEATAIADLLRVSLDTLLGRRRSASRENDLHHSLYMLRRTARRSAQEVWVGAQALHEQLEDMPSKFDESDTLRHDVDETWHRLISAFEALVDLTSFADRLIEREQDRQSEQLR